MEKAWTLAAGTRRVLLLMAAVAALSAVAAPVATSGEEPADREAALLFNTASRFYRQKNYKDAAETFSDFLKKYPQHKDALEARFAAGYSLSRLGDHARAVEHLRLAAAAEGPPWSADASFYLARSLETLAKDPQASAEERNSRLTSAAESYGKAARLYEKLSRGAARPPSSKDAGTDEEKERSRSRDLRVLSLGAQGEAFYQAQKFSEAAQALDVVLKEAPAMAESPHYHRAVYVLGLSRYALARKRPETEKSPETGPGRFKAAREALAAAAAERFEGEALWEEAAFLLGRLAHQEGSLPEAIEVYGRVAGKRGGRAAEAAYYRALALYESRDEGSLRQARKEFGLFLQKEPKHALSPSARFHEALCAFELKDHAGAEALFAVAARESPSLAGRALLRRGQALLLKSPPDAKGAADALAEATPLLEKEASESKSDPSSARRLAEAFYWRGEALLAQGGEALGEAAAAYSQVHARFAKDSPELAEKSLYQAALALHLWGKDAECAQASELYRKAYPEGTGKYHAESLLLSAESGFRAAPAQVPESLRRDAPRYYREAAGSLKDAKEALRARFMEGVALYFLGQYEEAAAALEAAGKEIAGQGAGGEATFVELPFYLADSIVLQPKPQAPGPEHRASWGKAAGLYRQYLERPGKGAHAASAWVHLGLCQRWLDDNEGARKTFETFLAGYSSHELSRQVRFELAGILSVLGDLDGAAASYAAVAEGPTGGGEGELLALRALREKALLERRATKTAQAAETLAALIERAGAVAGEKGAGEKAAADEAAGLAREARYQLGLALSEAGKPEEARKALAAFLEKHPESPEEAGARSELARLLLDAGRAEEALAVLDPLLGGEKALAGRDQALYLSAWCHFALAGKPGAGGGGPAAGEAAPAVQESPEAARHRESGEAAYRALLAEHPESELTLDAMLELGQHLFNRKAYAESKTLLDKVCKALEAGSGPVPADVARRSGDLLEKGLFGLGFIAFDEGSFAEAAKLLDKVAARAASPLAARAAFQAGRALMKAGDMAGAAERFQKLTAELKGPPELQEEGLLRLGECLHQMQKYAEAVQVLERMLQEHPKAELRHEGMFALGFARQFSGEIEKAVEAYKAVVADSRAPVAARAQYHAGECRMEEKKYREAAREFAMTVANFDFDGEYREWVRRSLLGGGTAYQLAGDKTAAVAQFRELADRFPDTEEGKAASERLRELEGSE